MDFNNAFAVAADATKKVSVAGKSETWGQWFRFRERPRFRATDDERRRAISVLRRYCRDRYVSGEPFIVKDGLDVAKKEVGMDPFTALWLISVVVQLFDTLRKLLSDDSMERVG